jgi:hypothetical protein
MKKKLLPLNYPYIALKYRRFNPVTKRITPTMMRETIGDIDSADTMKIKSPGNPGTLTCPSSIPIL